MNDRGNKTIMCSVLFLDIVEYSKKSVAGQISLKDRFNGYLSEAIRDMPVADRIILDTGDGAAINFLGDVEDALKAALSLRENLLKEDPDSDNPLQVRIGINLGPVRLVRDINGQPNIVGDGINVAQRVMGFANPSQILVSRSYYDAVSRLSPQYAEMFRYEGSRTDKHVREHEVYAIGFPGEFPQSPLSTIEADGGDGENQSALPQSEEQAGQGGGSLLDRYRRLEPRQRAIYAGVGAAFLVAGLAIKLTSHKEAPPQPSAPAVAVVEPAASDKQVAAEPKHTPTPGKDMQQKPVEKKPAPAKPAPPRHPQAGTAQSKPAEPAARPGFFEQAPAAASGFVSVTCKEGAHVFVDGAQKGAVGSGALTVGVTPGKHTVIVSHPSGGIFNQNVEIESGKTVRIKPAFCGQ